MKISILAIITIVIMIACIISSCGLTPLSTINPNVNLNSIRQVAIFTPGSNYSSHAHALSAKLEILIMSKTRLSIVNISDLDVLANENRIAEAILTQRERPSSINELKRRGADAYIIGEATFDVNATGLQYAPVGIGLNASFKMISVHTGETIWATTISRTGMFAETTSFGSQVDIVASLIADDLAKYFPK